MRPGAPHSSGQKLLKPHMFDNLSKVCQIDNTAVEKLTVSAFLWLLLLLYQMSSFYTLDIRQTLGDLLFFFSSSSSSSFFFEFASLPHFYFPCGKIVQKKEGTSVQPRSHPCTVWIRAEVSANRGRLQSSDLETNSSVYPDLGRSWVHTSNWLR